MSAHAWNAFCVVGLGGHARGKLLPALVANGQLLAGVVSSNPDAASDDVKVFRSVVEALENLPPETAFVLASPPAAHFRQALPLLNAGRDVIVEKPAFVFSHQALEAAGAASRGGGLLVEAFMHRHTELYRRFLEDWRDQGPAIEGIEVSFLIPAAPTGTFREQWGLESSLLYDVGCYAVSLLGDLGLLGDGLELTEVVNAGNPLAEQYRIEEKAGGRAISVLMGIADQYRNEVLLRSRAGCVSYSPFFYGRPGARAIERRSGATCDTETLTEPNAFETMLATPVETYRADQADRLRRMVEATDCLERLGGQLRERRQQAALGSG